MLIDFHTHLDWYQDKKALFEDLGKFPGKIQGKGTAVH